MNPMIVMMAASTAMSIYGNWKAQKDKEAAARRQHELAVKQANEIRRRTEYNKTLIDRAGVETQGQIAGMTAKSGMEMSGSVMDAMIDVARSVEEEKTKMQQEVDYSIEALMTGADANLDVIRKEGNAQALSSIGSLFQFGAQTIDKWDYKKKTT